MWIVCEFNYAAALQSHCWRCVLDIQAHTHWILKPSSSISMLGIPKGEHITPSTMLHHIQQVTVAGSQGQCAHTGGPRGGCKRGTADWHGLGEEGFEAYLDSANPEKHTHTHTEGRDIQMEKIK